MLDDNGVKIVCPDQHPPCGDKSAMVACLSTSRRVHPDASRAEPELRMRLGDATFTDCLAAAVARLESIGAIRAEPASAVMATEPADSEMPFTVENSLVEEATSDIVVPTGVCVARGKVHLADQNLAIGYGHGLFYVHADIKCRLRGG